MAEKNGNSTPPRKAHDLSEFEQRVKAAQSKHTGPQDQQADDGSLLGMAWRMSTELVVAVLVGFGLGYGLDRLFGTAPWIMVIGIGFGFAAGIKNTLRTADKMNEAEAKRDLPPPQDLPDTDDDDD